MIEKIHINRSRQKFIIYSIIVVWLLAINLWLFRNSHSRTSLGSFPTTPSHHSIYNQYDDDIVYGVEEPEEPEQEAPLSIKEDFTVQLLQNNLKVKDIRGVDAHAQVYNTIFKNHNIDSIFGNLDFQHRCELYFRNLFLNDHNWAFNPNEDLELKNRDDFKYVDYYRAHSGEWKNEYAKKLDKPADQIPDSDPDLKKYVKQEYYNWLNLTRFNEQKIIDGVSTLRIFNKCYLSNDNTTQVKSMDKFIKNQHTLVNALASSDGESIPKFELTKQESLINLKQSSFEHRVYPWLSFEPPVYESWHGNVYYQPPNLQAIRKGKPQPTKSKSQYFLSQFRDQCNGKGIVLSIGDKHADDTVRLIHLLRALNNKLPIQIVYYDKLSVESKAKIVTAAREPFNSLPKSFNKIAHYFPDDYLTTEENGLPKQEVWFVNTYNVINNEFKDKFNGFGNKFLATLFNSFEEFILIDADTAMMQNPEFFFQLKGYKENGAFFYKDRSSFETRKESDGYFFKKISPSIIDSVMFNIPIITEHTINREFFDGAFQYMESGLVVLNRQQHYNAMLMMLQLNFYHPVTTRIHGDKEIFWLAMSISGEENYQFNDYFAAAIGEATPETDRIKQDGTNSYSKEICSPHPGHINSEDGHSLVWINSGFQFCGQAHKVDYDKEYKKNLRLKWLTDAEAFKTFYYAPLRISHAVIPPVDVGFKGENIENEPEKGWAIEKEYCNSYMWCAYSSIGGRIEGGGSNRREGSFIDFPQGDRDLFSYYGDIWVGLE
ncbi:putative alpha-13-mannosyltransferase MNN12 [Spathaspora sp. JA1]|nr:putative alpha-13-mannosyltransferase MNN12 [Spathaspora sp. JA1]